jgi:hypothetical protein
LIYLTLNSAARDFMMKKGEFQMFEMEIVRDEKAARKREANR